jgi:hypothetical protein
VTTRTFRLRKISVIRVSGQRFNNKNRLKGEMRVMNKRGYIFAAALPVLLFGGVASAQQYPIVDEIAAKVVQKYQNSSCEQLWEQRGQPKSPREQEFMQAMRNNPQIRAVFIDRVAAPVANKMFECGLLP